VSDTLKNVRLKKCTWINLYTAISEVKGSPVAVGTALGLSMLDYGKIRVNVGPTQPTADSGYEVITGFGYAENETGDSGFWAYSESRDALVNIKEI
jgi:hypothetical protein